MMVVKKTKSLLYCIVMAVLYFLVQIVSGVLFSIIYLLGKEKVSNLELLLDKHSLLIHIFAGLIFLFVVFLLARSKKKTFRISPKLSKALALWSILLAMSYSLIWSIVTKDMNIANLSAIKLSFNYYKESSAVLAYLLLILSVYILAPFLEELLYRRIMVNRLEEDFSKVQSVVITSLIFGLSHFLAGGQILSLGSFIMGLIFGFIYITSDGSLLLAFLAHAMANTADIIVQYITSNMLIVFVAILIIALVISLMKMIKYIRNKDTR